MEDGRLNQAQGRHGRVGAFAGLGEQAGQMALDAQFGLFERDRRIVAIAGQQVEAELRVEDGLGHVLEGEQADGLVLQFLHAGRAVLAGRGEDLNHGTADGIVGVQAAQEECERDGGGMGDDVDGGFGRVVFEFGFDDGRAQAGVGALFGGGGEIDDGGVGRVAEQFEGLAAGFGAAGEDDGAGVEQALGGESADDGGFIADASEGAGLFVVGGDQAQREIGSRRWRRGRGFRGRAGSRCR